MSLVLVHLTHKILVHLTLKMTTAQVVEISKWTNNCLYTKVSRSVINLKIVIIIRFCMPDELNGHALPVHHTKPSNFQNDSTSRYFGLWLSKLVHLLNLFFFQWGVLFMCLIKL